MNLTTDLYQRIAIAKIYIDENFHEAIDLESDIPAGISFSFSFSPIVPESVSSHPTSIHHPEEN